MAFRDNEKDSRRRTDTGTGGRRDGSAVVSRRISTPRSDDTGASTAHRSGTFADRSSGAEPIRPAGPTISAEPISVRRNASKGARQYTPVGEQAQRPTAAATVAEEKQRLADSWAGAAGTPKRNYRTRNGNGGLR